MDLEANEQGRIVNDKLFWRKRDQDSKSRKVGVCEGAIWS